MFVNVLLQGVDFKSIDWRKDATRACYCSTATGPITDFGHYDLYVLDATFPDCKMFLMDDVIRTNALNDLRRGDLGPTESVDYTVIIGEKYK